MEDKYKLLLAPQLGVNDESAVIVKWLCNDKEKVFKGDIVCILESTKATIELEVSNTGHIKILVNEGESVKLNQEIGIIIFDEKNIDHVLDNYKDKHDNKKTILSITKKAKELLKKHNIEIDQLSDLGSIIRTKDVEKLINERKNKTLSKLKIRDSSKSVIIFGAGKGGATVFETLDLGNEFEVVAFIDENISGSFLGKPVYGLNELDKILIKNVNKIFVAIANGKKRSLLGKTFEKKGFKLINAIHPNSYISPTTKIGNGNHIKAGAIIDANTIIGSNNIIDNGVIIAHDNKIGDGCHLAPGCALGSSIEINDFSILGIGSSISTRVKIGEGCIVLLNTSVTNDIEDNTLVEGVPGKTIGKTNI